MYTPAGHQVATIGGQRRAASAGDRLALSLHFAAREGDASVVSRQTLRILERAVACSLSLVLTRGLAATSAMAQPAAAQAPPARAPWTLTVSNLTRVESWSFFEPPSSGGNPDYTFAGNRLRVGLNWASPRVEVAGSVQYVQFGGLPNDAVGPGPLGTGALYFEHAGTASSRGVYLRTLNLRARLWRGLAIQAGRFGYTSGAESPSGRPKLEAAKRARLDSRLLGEFEWSLYQRAFDGVRGDLDGPRWRLTAAWLRPTQGGFEDDAGASLHDVDVGTVTLTLRPGAVAPATELALFANRYDDERPVSARPDNSGRTATAVDVGITTFGASAVGSAPAAAGEADWLLWLAGQRGSWYELSQASWSLAVEGGYQWRTSWQPWLRAGYLRASGDEDPGDDRHGTFFPVLPTVRRYSFTTAYAPMNLTDAFVEIIVRPLPRLTARADVRRLRLAEAADRWYAGSGATRRRGGYFGYAGRTSGGHADLGTACHGAADLRLSRYWSVNGFIGTMRGGRVVESLFAGRWLRFMYVENVIQF